MLSMAAGQHPGPDRIDRLLSRLGGADPDLRLRAELVLGIGALQVLIIGLFCIFEFARGTKVVGVVCLIGLVATLLVLVDLIRRGQVKRAAVRIMVILFSISAILNLGSGGQTVGVSVALPSLVLVGALILSHRAALLLFLLVVLQLLLVSGMDHASGGFLINPDPAWSPGSIVRVPLMISIATAFVGLLVRRALLRHRANLARIRRTLRANEKQLREIIENSRGLICTHDLDGVLLSANPAAARALGYQVDELLGTNIRDLVPEKQRERLAEYLARIEASESDSGALCINARNGDMQIWEYHNRLCRNSDGVAYVLCNAMDMTARRKLEEKLREQSVRDPLTGCFNRRYLALAEGQFCTDQDWGCVFIDLDNFKKINDTHGHRGGDLMLIAMGRFLNKHARPGDAVIRMGGDEFLLLLPQGGATTEAIARRIRSAACRNAPCDISIGFAAREGGESLERTIERADRQLYRIRTARRRKDRRGQSGSD